MDKGHIKSRPDYHQTTRAIVSMNKEAGQIQESKRRHNYRENLDPEKLNWLIWLSHNWKWYFVVSRISGLNPTQRHHPKSPEAHASGNREAFTDNDRWEGNWWTTSWWEKSRWKWDDEVWGFFLSQDFAPTLVYTHSVSHAHFFSDTFSLRGVQTSRTRVAQGVCSSHVTSPHLTFSFVMFHPPSLLFPHGHLDTSYLPAPSLPELFPIRKRGSRALPHECRGVCLPGRSDALHRFPEERVRSWMKFMFPMPNSDPVHNYSLNFKKGEGVLLETVEDQHPGDLCGHPQHSPSQASHKEPFLRPRGSAKLFLPILRTEEPCQCRSPKWLQEWCVITTKMNDNLTQHFTGTPQCLCC